MAVLILIVFGLCLGSFVNALVWRLHEQGVRGTGRAASKKKKTIAAKDLSILKGRSMCPNCKHELAPKDLVPVVSWLSLRGKCRYCHKKFDDTPLTELVLPALFIFSYFYWPLSFNTMGTLSFVTWLIALTGFMALLVYDLRWLILPNRIIYPLAVLAGVDALLNITVFHGGVHLLKDIILSVAIAGGLFYGLFTLSNGKWIGGGDVKLGLLIGLLITDPLQAFLVLFTASLLGTMVILPGLASKKLNSRSKVPFGPFLIVATVLVRLFGASVITWYRRKFLLY